MSQDRIPRASDGLGDTARQIEEDLRRFRDALQAISGPPPAPPSPAFQPSMGATFSGMGWGAEVPDGRLVAPRTGEWTLALWNGWSDPYQIPVRGLAFSVTNDETDPLEPADRQIAIVPNQTQLLLSSTMTDDGTALAKAIAGMTGQPWTVATLTEVAMKNGPPEPVVFDADEDPSPTPAGVPEAGSMEERVLRDGTGWRFSRLDDFVQWAGERGFSQPKGLRHQAFEGCDRALLLPSGWVALFYPNIVRVGRLRPEPLVPDAQRPAETSEDLRSTSETPGGVAEALEALTRALLPLTAVALAYHSGDLDEARPKPGLEDPRESELVSTRGGRTLLRLGDALDALDVVRRLSRRHAP